MTTFLRFARALARPLTPALALLLLGTLFAGSTHHHEGARSHETCAVCSVGHAPAHAAPEPVAVRDAAYTAERFTPFRAERPARIVHLAASSRAPPAIS